MKLLFNRKVTKNQVSLLPKTLLVMKLTACILLIFSLNVSAKTNAQTITLKGKNISLENVFNVIKNQTGYAFLYDAVLLKNGTPVSLSVKNEPLKNVLDYCFKNQPFTYEIKYNVIVVKERTQEIIPLQFTSVPQPPTEIHGKVTDSTGSPIANVSVTIKGSSRGTVTDANGEYHIAANSSDVLHFGYVGYKPEEVNVNNTPEINVQLRPADNTAEEVVVTALGIKRLERALSYNVQQVGTDDVNTIKQTNVINSLSGKVAGLSVLPSAGGVGGSVKVRIRGDRSIQGNNQPLYVIDGIPILNGGNNNSDVASSYGGTPDPGDGISNLNPDDIASISVLEGASAAALYGSQAQNGVILITTKKGREGKPVISFTSSYQNSHIAYSPKFQNQYGQSTFGSGDLSSWGGDTVRQAHDNLNEFFKDGANFTNAINLSAGSKTAQTYFSYANTHATGIEPTNDLMRHNFNLRENASFFNDKLTVDASATYINQTIENSPRIGSYNNPLVSLYLFPRGVDITPYKNNYLNPDSVGFKRQNWITDGGQNLFQESPWWIINRIPNKSIRNRFLFTASVKYEFASWLNVQARGNIDRISDDYEQDAYSGTIGLYNSNGNGNLIYSAKTVTQKYGDLIANFKIPLHSKTFKIDGLVGTSITDIQTKGLSAAGNLSAPDFFTPSNIIVTLPGTYGTPTLSNTTAITPNHTQLQAAFGNLNVSYKNWAYLTLTGRSDWSSNLSYTTNEQYFYPSAGLSLVLSEMLKLPSAISFAKLRGSLAQVGNTLYQPYLTHPQNTLTSSGSLSFNTAQGPVGFKPEKTNTFEVGTDIRFLANRINFSFTFYKSNTRNQLFSVSLSPTTLISTAYINAGNIQNTGITFTLGYDVLKGADFTWNTSFNGTLNRNKIIALNGAIPFNYGYNNRLVVGGSYGDVYANNVLKDSLGRVVLAGDGSAGNPYRPQATSSSAVPFIGNPNPKFQLGWNNSFEYKKFNLSFLVDGRFGGKVISVTQAYLDLAGVSEVTGQARQQGGVKVNGVDANGKAVTTVDAKTWYQTLGARDAFPGAYSYSATVVRLREVALGYNIPFDKSFVKNIRLSLTGRNLFFFSKKAPFDPEIATATSLNGYSGVDIFNMPTTRDIGINLNVTF